MSFCMLLNDTENCYLCLLTVFHCEMFLLLRVSDFLGIKALVSAAGRCLPLPTWCSQLRWQRRLDVFLVIDDRQKLILIIPKAFLSARSADADPNMAKGSAATLHRPGPLSEIPLLRVDGMRRRKVDVKSNWKEKFILTWSERRCEDYRWSFKILPQHF